MSAFHDMLADDAALFVDPDYFGEAVTYKPRVGSPRPINALIEREEVEGQHLLYASVENNASTGIATSEIDVGGDRITLAERMNGTSRDHLIQEVMSQDAGMIRVRLSASI